MANREPTPNHTIYLNSLEQACSLVHLCAFSQQMICTFLTHILKCLASISNKFLYSATTSSPLFLVSLQGSQILAPYLDYVKKGIQGL
jgi:hypothetical protein